MWVGFIGFFKGFKGFIRVEGINIMLGVQDSSRGDWKNFFGLLSMWQLAKTCIALYFLLAFFIGLLIWRITFLFSSSELLAVFLSCP